MEKNYDTLVFIGRMMPFHKGHYHIVSRALTLAKQVVIGLGSAEESPNPRNPFTFEQRCEMIRSCFPKDAPIVFVPLVDYPYDDSRWVANVQRKVGEVAGDGKVGLIGHDKDSSSFYLKLFPAWGSVKASNIGGIDATAIRTSLFGKGDIRTSMLQPQVVKWLERFVETEQFQYIKAEHDAVNHYKKIWEAAPYKPTFVTVDAMVTQSGHVLMVKRLGDRSKGDIGAGLWALAGGFLEQHETLLEGAIRELKEETRIDVPPAVLRGNISGQKVFDHPNRSLRGRTITTAFHIALPDAIKLPKVKGSDDAEKAKWFPLGELRRDMCFEDHYHIISHFTGI